MKLLIALALVLAMANTPRQYEKPLELRSPVDSPSATNPASECPAETPRARRYADWLPTVNAEFLAKVGLTGATAGEIRLLRTDTDSAVCAQLSDIFRQAIEHEIEGARTHDVVHYQIRDRYMTVTVLRPHPDPDILATGLSEVYVHDMNFNYLGGVSG